MAAEEKRWKEQERTTNGLGNASWIDESDVQLLIEGKILLFSLGENSGCQSDDKDWFTTFELNKMRKISSKVDMTIKAGGKKWKSKRQVRDWEAEIKREEGMRGRRGGLDVCGRGGGG